MHLALTFNSDVAGIAANESRSVDTKAVRRQDGDYICQILIRALMGALRLFLAYGVLLAHSCELAFNRKLTCDPTWAFNLTGGRAVLFFYIVSGFLMSFVLETKYAATTRGTRHFYSARALRIFPLWWAVFIFATLTEGATWLHQSPIASFSAFFLVGSDWMVSFATYPHPYFGLFVPGTDIGWTLGAELTFYLLAPWLLRSDSLALLAFFVSFLFRLVVFFTVRPHTPTYLIWSYFFLPSTFMFFMLGHLVRRIQSKVPFGLWLSIAFLAAALLLSTREGPISVDYLPSYGAAFLFALALPGIFEATKKSHLLNWLGDLTYPLYLTHTLVLWGLFGEWSLIGAPGELFTQVSRSVGSLYLQGLLFCGLLTLTCILAALAVHACIERPLRSLIRWILTTPNALVRQSDIAQEPSPIQNARDTT